MNDTIGSGVNVSHASYSTELFVSVLNGVREVGLDVLSTREATEDELLLEEAYRKKYPVEEEEEEEEEEEDDDEEEAEEEEEDED